MRKDRYRGGGEEHTCLSPSTPWGSPAPPQKSPRPRASRPIMFIQQRRPPGQQDSLRYKRGRTDRRGSLNRRAGGQRGARGCPTGGRGARGRPSPSAPRTPSSLRTDGRTERQTRGLKGQTETFGPVLPSFLPRGPGGSGSTGLGRGSGGVGGECGGPDKRGPAAA